MSSHYRYVLVYKDNESRKKTASLKTLYKLVYGKNFCVDNITDKEGEEWKSINELYKVSSKGRIKSFCDYEAIIVKPQRMQSGYERVLIYNGDGTRSQKLVHILVANAFDECGKPEDDSWQVHHLNNIPYENFKENLKWLSAEEHKRIHNNINRKES